MSLPVPRGRPPERWRGWPGEFWDPFGNCASPERLRKKRRRQELRRRHGTFAYRGSLPSDADPEKIDAQLTNGVLTVRLPKAAQSRSRRIEIKD